VEFRIVADASGDTNCVFCRIVSGEIPSARVLETSFAVAFLDIQPLNPGHTLIVPRSHHPQLSDLPEEIATHVGSLLPQLCRAVKSATGAAGLNVVVNNGQVAGQTIDHCHWHIIPRFVGDPIHWPWTQGRYAGDEMGRMKAKIEQAVGTHTIGGGAESSRTE
jgi:histidine triad (HIT) family protein